MVSAFQKWVLSLLIIGLALSITYVVYGTFFQHLWYTWQVDPFYKHGLWILVLSAGLYIKFLYDRQDKAILALSSLGQNKSVFYFILAATLFAGGVYTQLPFLGGLSFFFWMLSIQYLFFFPSEARSFSYPFLYFLCAVPLPYLGEISGLLQVVIAKLSYGIFHLLQYPITQEGIYISFPNAAFIIAPNCTGITSWLVLFALCLFFLNFVSGSLTFKITMACLILPIAFISNLVRVWSLLMFGFYKGQDFAMQYWHDFGGMTFYVIACLLVMLTFLGLKKYGWRE
jgi:exosortase